MLIDSVIIVLGIGGLIWGADLFVLGASAIARNLGVSPLLIGLTIVAFGTSSPEIFSSAAAALEGEPELAIGNAIGSNLFNVGVALAVAALIRPLKTPRSLARKELPALLMVTLSAGVLLLDYELGRFDALMLIIITLYICYRLFRQRTSMDAFAGIGGDDRRGEASRFKMILYPFYLLLGLAMLVVSAEALVSASSNIAEALGVSTAIIGLTIVALGTSLPELAASVACVLRGHHDLAIGNIIGSNIFNLLAVLPFPGLLAPGPVEAQLVERDFPFMFVLTLLLAWFCYRRIRRGGGISRLAGALFLSIYCIWFIVMLDQTINL